MIQLYLGPLRKEGTGINVTKSSFFIVESREQEECKKKKKKGNVSIGILHSCMEVNMRINSLKCWKWLSMGSDITG